jgi:hypothetical protein
VLSETAAAEEEISVVSRLLCSQCAERGFRTEAKIAQRLHVARTMRGEVSIGDQICAARAQFGMGGSDVSAEILVPLLDEAQAQELRHRIIAQRRLIEEMRERRDALSRTTTVELDVDVLRVLSDWGC